jgi:hypothetical protein
MNGFIARLLNACRAWPQGRALSANRAPATEPDTRETARQLGLAIDRAVRLSLWDHADRLAASASRLSRQHPQLTDRLARLRLAQRKPEAALQIIDSCAWQSASLRLLRAVCQLSLGRRQETHMDLQQWSGRAAAPMQARVLLALLEWKSGDERAALAALQRNLRQIEDPLTLLVLGLIGTAQQRNAWAVQWFDRLRAIDLNSPSSRTVEFVLRTIDHRQAQKPSPAAVERQIRILSAELTANEHVIPVLVESQRLHPDEHQQALLAAAIERAMPSLDDLASAKAALEQLERAAGDETKATLETIRTAETAEDDRADVLATIGPDELAMQEHAA